MQTKGQTDQSSAPPPPTFDIRGVKNKALLLSLAVISGVLMKAHMHPSVLLIWVAAFPHIEHFFLSQSGYQYQRIFLYIHLWNFKPLSCMAPSTFQVTAEQLYIYLHNDACILIWQLWFLGRFLKRISVYIHVSCSHAKFLKKTHLFTPSSVWPAGLCRSNFNINMNQHYLRILVF